MEINDGYKYLETHEWVRVEGDTARVGISAPACEQLGELVYFDLPEEGSQVSRGDVVCAVESVKAASDLYAPLSGIITGINSELEEEPEQLQKDPYGIHIFTIKFSDESELELLLDADAYRKVVGE